MAFFAGTYRATIDDKGRVVLPSAFKKAMGENIPDQVVLEKNRLGKCLDIHPMQVWQEKVEKFQAKVRASTNPAHFAALRQYFRNFAPVSLAANGRINIPDEYLKYANLEGKVTFLGMGASISLSNEIVAEADDISDDAYLDMLREFDL
jgi:MraZ protein